MFSSYFSTTQDDGRGRARHLMVAAVVGLTVALPGAHLTASVDPARPPDVTVREERGTYSVAARFAVPQAPAAVLAVLSDYEQIPRYMPDVRTSVVLERAEGRATVEQEAMSEFMWFSKKIHLILEVTETADALRFVDRSGKSFHEYSGAWHVVSEERGSMVRYELTARPAFDVPGFVLKRLLKRDAGEMISRLRIEIASRARP